MFSGQPGAPWTMTPWMTSFLYKQGIVDRANFHVCCREGSYLLRLCDDTVCDDCDEDLNPTISCLLPTRFILASFSLCTEALGRLAGGLPPGARGAFGGAIGGPMQIKQIKNPENMSQTGPGPCHLAFSGLVGDRKHRTIGLSVTSVTRTP